MFKAFTAEGGIRTPFLVKLPGEMPNAGTMNHSFFHVRDIMPTILDLAGIEQPREIDGRQVVPMQGSSVLNLFEGNVEATSPEVGRVGYELFGLKAFFDGDWKILWMPPPFGPGEWELFNLRQDPAELNDVSAEYPDRLAEMIALWEQYKEANGVLDVAIALGQ